MEYLAYSFCDHGLGSSFDGVHVTIETGPWSIALATWPGCLGG